MEREQQDTLGCLILLFSVVVLLLQGCPRIPRLGFASCGLLKSRRAASRAVACRLLLGRCVAVLILPNIVLQL